MTANSAKRMRGLMSVVAIVLIVLVSTYSWSYVKLSLTQHANRSAVQAVEIRSSGDIQNVLDQLAVSLQTTNDCDALILTPLHNRLRKECRNYDQNVTRAITSLQTMRDVDAYVASTQKVFDTLLVKADADPALVADQYFKASDAWKKIIPPADARNLHAQFRTNLIDVRQTVLRIEEAQQYGAPYRLQRSQALLQQQLTDIKKAGLELQAYYQYQADEVQRTLKAID